jgi:alkylated DNA repair dioxygenase AlkB
VTAPSDLTIARRAVVQRIALDEHSWVDVVEGFVVDPDREFTGIFDESNWMQQEVLRYDRYVPEQRLSTGLRPDSRPLLRQTDLHLQSVYRVPFEGVAAILYRDGSDFQGLHSDRAMQWLDDTRIAIVVLGVRRPFVIRPRGSWVEAAASKVPSGDGPDDVVLLPGEGTLLVMGGACQRDWLHGIPAADTARARISLTWRWTARRGRPDTNPGHYEGRQFRDAERRPGTRARRPGMG